MKKTTFKLDNGIVLSNIYDLDGGGSTHYRDFLEIINIKGKRSYTRALEWCAGPAFIGYAMLGNNICDHLVLMDIYEPAIVSCRNTAINNNLYDSITTYCIDAISKLPTTEKFDLVLGNPPHVSNRNEFIDHMMLEAKEHGDTLLEYNIDLATRLVVDQDQAIHIEFFKNICKYLLPSADLFISEPGNGEMMPEIIEYATTNGLTFIGDYPLPSMRASAQHATILHFKGPQ